MVEIDSRSMCELEVHNNETWFPLASAAIRSAVSMKRIFPLPLIAIRADFPVAKARVGESPLSKNPPLLGLVSPYLTLTGSDVPRTTSPRELRIRRLVPERPRNSRFSMMGDLGR